MGLKLQGKEVKNEKDVQDVKDVEEVKERKYRPGPKEWIASYPLLPSLPSVLFHLSYLGAVEIPPAGFLTASL
jgi:hypothetical protein